MGRAKNEFSVCVGLVLIAHTHPESFTPHTVHGIRMDFITSSFSSRPRSGSNAKRWCCFCGCTTDDMLFMVQGRGIDGTGPWSRWSSSKMKKQIGALVGANPDLESHSIIL